MEQEFFLVGDIKCKINKTNDKQKTTKFHLNWFAPMEWNWKISSLWKYRHICDSLRSFALSLASSLSSQKQIYVFRWGHNMNYNHMTHCRTSSHFPIYFLSLFLTLSLSLSLPPLFGSFVSFRGVVGSFSTNVLTSSFKQKPFFFLAISKPKPKQQTK